MHVHVIGPPRSGTTLMMELLKTCFHFPVYFNEEVYISLIAKQALDNPLLLSKKPSDHEYVKPILERDEGVVFISMIRDPRDVVVSRHGKRPDIYWANLRQWRECYQNQSNCFQHPRLIPVRYEDLVEKPDIVQKQISNRLPDITVRKAFSQYHQYAQPSEQSLQAMRTVRPVSNESIGSWKKHLPRLAGQIQIHGSITEELIAMGYEKDDDWMSLLDGVIPDLTAGRWPEFISPEIHQKEQLEIISDLAEYFSIKNLD